MEFTLTNKESGEEVAITGMEMMATLGDTPVVTVHFEGGETNFVRGEEFIGGENDTFSLVKN